MRSSRTFKSSASHPRLLLTVAVVVIAASVWGMSRAQRTTSDRTFAASTAGQRILSSMLDQETGLRGFSLTHSDSFLVPFREGLPRFEQAVVQARQVTDSTMGRRELDRQVATAATWRRMAEDQIARTRVLPKGTPNTQGVELRKAVFDRFRAANTIYQSHLDARRTHALNRGGLLSVALVLLIAVGFGTLGHVMIERDTKRRRLLREEELDYRNSQSEFAQTMQVMRDEHESHTLLKRHLELRIPGSEVVVLNRNNSDNRLTASTDVGERSVLGDALRDAEPESCLAVRLGRTYRESEGVEPLLSCGLCGRSAAEIKCVPSLVSGEVIGSVLIRGERVLDERERDRINDSVTQAAPVLANLRNLAIAESQAATDALTGLANARSCQDNLKRMVAHAGRTKSQLSCVMIDLDHFKQVNDRYGHGAGDDVLASVGEVLTSGVRASDFSGRYGGEEFLVLLPDTAAAGAAELCEKLRTAIAAIDVPSLEGRITASFGLATYPDLALDGDALMRMADRALYSAKREGRNRVEVAEPSSAAANVAPVS